MLYPNRLVRAESKGFVALLCADYILKAYCHDAGDYDVMETKSYLARLRESWSDQLVYDRMFPNLA